MQKRKKTKTGEFLTHTVRLAWGDKSVVGWIPTKQVAKWPEDWRQDGLFRVGVLSD